MTCPAATRCRATRSATSRASARAARRGPPCRGRRQRSPRGSSGAWYATGWSSKPARSPSASNSSRPGPGRHDGRQPGTCCFPVPGPRRGPPRSSAVAAAVCAVPVATERARCTVPLRPVALGSITVRPIALRPITVGPVPLPAEARAVAGPVRAGRSVSVSTAEPAPVAGGRPIPVAAAEPAAVAGGRPIPVAAEPTRSALETASCAALVPITAEPTGTALEATTRTALIAVTAESSGAIPVTAEA